MNVEDPVSIEIGPPVRCLVALIDTRGFSEFAQKENDPTGVADYVSRAMKYILKTIGDSSQLARYAIKPLGDGLLFILNLEGATKATVANSALVMLRELLAVSGDFSSHLKANPPPGISGIPERLGIGLAFGPLVRLSVRSSKPAVDFDEYVGHTINLAARLQELARSGGCVAHEDVYDKIFKQDADAGGYFLRVLNQPLEVRLRNIGGSGETLVYTNADIPPEYLKSKADETKVEEFAKQAISALKNTYLKKRSAESERRLLSEITRFMLFRREGDSFREIVEYVVGQRLTLKREIAITIEEGVCPIAEAVLTRDTVLVSYTCRYDECDERDPNSEYWRQTLERFPKARTDSLRKLPMHPASIMAIPLDPPQADQVSAVAAFDSPEKGIFNEDIAAEMEITLRVLYGQLFGPQEMEGPGVIEL